MAIEEISIIGALAAGSSVCAIAVAAIKIKESISQQIRESHADVCRHLETATKTQQRELDNHEHRIQKLEDIVR